MSVCCVCVCVVCVVCVCEKSFSVSLRRFLEASVLLDLVSVCSVSYDSNRRLMMIRSD